MGGQMTKKAAMTMAMRHHQMMGHSKKKKVATATRCMMMTEEWRVEGIVNATTMKKVTTNKVTRIRHRRRSSDLQLLPWTIGFHRGFWDKSHMAGPSRRGFLHKPLFYEFVRGVSLTWPCLTFLCLAQESFSRMTGHASWSS